MRFIGLALLFLALPAWGQIETLSVQGRDRWWTQHIPPGGAAGRPLVVALHGGGGSGVGFDEITQGQLTREARRRRWVVVFPEGLEKGWNDGRPPASRRDERRQAVDDVAFLDAMVDWLIAHHQVDPTRVYFTGMSNGGFMSQRYALDHADKVAAIGLVVATVAEAWAARRPTRPVPALFLLGSEDPLVPYAGGQVVALGTERGAVLSAAASLRHWAVLDGCGDTPVRETLADRAPRDETRAVVDRFPCPAGVGLELWTLEGGGHTWPLGQQYLPKVMVGRVSREVDGAGVLFDFFARHQR